MNRWIHTWAMMGVLCAGVAGVAIAQQSEDSAPRSGSGYRTDTTAQKHVTRPEQPAAPEVPYSSLAPIAPDGASPPPAQIPPPGSPSAAPAPRGHYQGLLTTIDAPEDQAAQGDFCDAGYRNLTSYKRRSDLPPGYWVYLAPRWYIFKTSLGAGQAQGPRPWGPEQATGAPDTWPNSGDLTTAWASQTPDDQREWLELTYAHASRAIAIAVYETFNPGAVDRVTTFDSSGREIELWAGADPTPPSKPKGISVIAIHPDFDVTRIRIYLDSPKVAGWNEIDAVGLLDQAGKMQWAASATASSTYADNIANPTGAEPIDLSHLGASGDARLR